MTLGNLTGEPWPFLDIIRTKTSTSSAFHQKLLDGSAREMGRVTFKRKLILKYVKRLTRCEGSENFRQDEPNVLLEH